MNDSRWRTRQAELESRVEALETAVRWILLIPPVVLLTVGTFLPFLHDDEGSTHETDRLLTFGFQVFGWDEDPGKKFFFGAGFVGLLIVTIVCVCVMIGGLYEKLGSTGSRVAKVAGTLLLIGALVMALLVIGETGDQPEARGVGLWVYLLGAAWATTMMLAAQPRELWADDDWK